MKKRGFILDLSRMFPRNKIAQVWIETVMYVLIALVIIGLVISFVEPKISEMQDRAILEQSLAMLTEIDNTLIALSQGGVGNVRKIELGIRKGSLTVDSTNDKIFFEMESKHIYTEPGVDVTIGKVVTHTKEIGRTHFVNMTLKYNNYNLTYNGEEINRNILESSNPYNVFISNKGGDPINIDFRID